MSLAQTTQINLSSEAWDLLEELTIMNQLGRYPAHCGKNMPSLYAMGMDLPAALELLDAITKALPNRLHPV